MGEGLSKELTTYDSFFLQRLTAYAYFLFFHVDLCLLASHNTIMPLKNSCEIEKTL